MDLQLPKRGFTKAERAWLAEILEALKTVRAVSGKNIAITDADSGQVIAANDCGVCPE